MATVNPGLTGKMVETPEGVLFQLTHGQPAWPKIFVIPGFGDEMNKGRSAVTKLADQLAEHQIGVQTLDLFGTGDSAGEFREADFSLWHRNLAWWLNQNPKPLGIVSIRLGSALATRALADSGLTLPHINWVPVWSARKTLKEMLRMKSVSLAMRGVKLSLKDLSASLEAGELVEAGGYEISSDLWLSAAEVEVEPDAQAIVLPLGKAAEDAQDSDLPFWNSTELRVPLHLIGRTVELIKGFK